MIQFTLCFELNIHIWIHSKGQLKKYHFHAEYIK